jgi:hypothetical protein
MPENEPPISMEARMRALEFIVVMHSLTGLGEHDRAQIARSAENKGAMWKEMAEALDEVERANGIARALTELADLIQRLGVLFGADKAKNSGNGQKP